MFNWYSAPTFAAMALFCALAAYVGLRSPRSPISLAAVAALVATAAYLLGQGMAANARAQEDWATWVGGLQWGATVAPALWFWVTLLVVREQRASMVRSYLRWVGYPMAAVWTATGALFAASIYVDDWLYAWSRIFPLPPEEATYSRFALPPGPLYPAFAWSMAGATVGAAANLLAGWRAPLAAEERRRFAWLLVSAVLFVVGANSLGIVNLLAGWVIPTWVGHLTLMAALVVMAWNVAAYSFLVAGKAAQPLD